MKFRKNMIYLNYLNAVANILDTRFKGSEINDMNPADKGELCEIFVKDLLNDFFSNLYQIFRGGSIIDVNGEKSKQIDIIITAKNTLKLFSDKGIYPIESIAGVFCITATLNNIKLSQDITVLESIPSNNPKIYLSNYIKDKDIFTKTWFRRFPFKCVFGFNGDIDPIQKVNDLNKIISENQKTHFLPDLIVINKKCLIYKVLKNTKFTFVHFPLDKEPGTFIIYLLHHLYEMSLLQSLMGPAYFKYFNKDLEKIIS